MRIYEGDFMVRRILEKCQIDVRDSMSSNGRVVEGVDLDHLSAIVQRIPVEDIRKRRQRLNNFYEEILVSADPVRGISFHTCLMVLAHHNVINDSKSLRLEEYLRRRARLQRVDEAVRRNTVIGFFDTLYWSRRFRQRINERRSARMEAVPQFEVPEILVDYQDSDNENGANDDDKSNPEQVVMGSADIASASHDGETSPMLSPTTRSRANTGTSQHRGVPLRINTSMGGQASAASSPTEWSAISPSLSRRVDMEAMYDRPDESDGLQRRAADHSRQNSAMSVQDVMDSLDNSAWGESIRRSFTQRRPRGE